MLPPLARLLSASLAATVVSLAVPATPAHAQFLKKIKQAATEKAAEAAGRKVLGDDKPADGAAAPAAASGASAARSSASTAAAPRANAPTKLDVTPERIDQMLAALEPYREVVKQREAHAAAEKKVEDYNKCLAAASQKQTAAMMNGTYTGPTKAQQAEVDRLLDQANEMNQRMIAAMQAGDTLRTRVLTDSSVRISTKAQALLNPYAAKACGTEAPPKPAQLDEGRLQKAGVPRRVDGWTPAQFGLMRERIAMYLLMPEKANLSPEERQAVDGKRAGFQPYVAMWKETGDWKSWGELWSAWKVD
jgi:hypothetical protein